MTETRSFSTFFSGRQLQGYQRGVMGYTYNGVPCLKSPLDLAIYLKLIRDTAPKTIIEIGSKSGGSAMLFRDFSSIVGSVAGVLSIDIKPPDISLEGVQFVMGSVLDLESVFENHGLFGLPRPWLVVEDSAHTLAGCRAALDFFSRRLLPGEYLVMEDGVLEELGLAKQYQGGPNRAIKEFLEEHPGLFAIATEYCDMFGQNATYNPNGYLRRTDGKISSV